MRTRSTCLFLAILVVMGLLTPAPSRAADTGVGTPRWFSQTGHTLAYSFGVFWELHGGLPVFGYPLSEVFVEDGRPVQYFERARFEWHGEDALVLAGHLGRWAAEEAMGQPAFAPVATPAQADQDYFIETSHTLAGSFRQFWQTHGGLSAFGFPLSEAFVESNQQDGQSYTVQYFERARFEWHPELSSGDQVQLGQLGRQYLEMVHPAPDWALAPVSSTTSAWDGVRPTHIQIPRINLATDIVEGGFSLNGWDVPRYTAVHYWPIAGIPGTRGNIVIAGHVGYRDTIFNQLPQVVVGDEILLSVGQSVQHYHVTATWIVLPTDSWTMAPTPDETLTLITCIPINVYDHRLIVRAVPDPPSSASPTTPQG